jgi:hypothetical protein
LNINYIQLFCKNYFKKKKRLLYKSFTQIRATSIYRDDLFFFLVLIKDLWISPRGIDHEKTCLN